MRARMLLATLVGCMWCSFATPSFGMAAPAGHYQLSFATPSSFASVSAAAQRNSYIVLQAWDTARARQIKAANPGTTVLMYQNFSAMAKGAGPSGLYSSGVGMEQADTAHPDWFLKNAGGARLTEGDYSWLYMADIGNAGYQSAWADNVVSRLSGGPFDGVFMDDVNTTAKYHTDPTKIARYPNDAAYQQATRSMLASVYPRLRAAGKLAIANIGSWTENPSVAADWLQFLDGGQDEMFAKWSKTPGVGYRPTIDWKIQLGEIATTESMGKRFLAVTQSGNGDAQAQRYGWASVLMAAQGRSAYLSTDVYSGDPNWLPEYDAAVGDPTGPMTSLGNGAYARTFTNGLVVVNPGTASASVRFGGTYSGSGLTNATSATLAPDTALVLTKGDRPVDAPVSTPSAPGVPSSGDSGTGTSGGTTPGSGTTPSSGTPSGGGTSAPSAPVTSPPTVTTPKTPVTTPKAPVTTKTPPKSTKKTTTAKKKLTAKTLAKLRAAKARAAKVKATKKKAAAKKGTSSKKATAKK